MLQDVKALLLGLAILAGLGLKATALRAEPTATAIVAGGCFWCVEADFEKVQGVGEVVSGYAGGDVPDPSYRQVVRGGTGHREAAEIRFDPQVISYGQILDLFLRSIDPFDDGGQFCDRGYSYTPAIYPADAEQRQAAQAAVARAEADLGRPIKVPIENAAPLYPAEAYHQDYYKKDDTILTRFGFETKASAYQKYRMACGRDARVRAVWGDAAPFAGS